MTYPNNRFRHYNDTKLCGPAHIKITADIKKSNEFT